MKRILSYIIIFTSLLLLSSCVGMKTDSTAKAPVLNLIQQKGELVVGITGVATRVDPSMIEKDAAWSDLVEGARFAYRSRLVQGIMLGAAFAMLALGAINVLFVPFLSSAFDDATSTRYAVCF